MLLPLRRRRNNVTPSLLFLFLSPASLTPCRHKKILPGRMGRGFQLKRYETDSSLCVTLDSTSARVALFSPSFTHRPVGDQCRAAGALFFFFLHARVMYYATPVLALHIVLQVNLGSFMSALVGKKRGKKISIDFVYLVEENRKKVPREREYLYMQSLAGTLPADDVKCNTQKKEERKTEILLLRENA